MNYSWGYNGHEYGIDRIGELQYRYLIYPLN